jgi:integrase/recombinase XerD
MATMSPLRRRMVEDMTVRNLSRSTQQSYIYAVAKFSRHFDCPPDRLGMEDVRAYQLHLIEQKFSWSHINQVACALRFFYGITLGQKEAFERIVSGKEPEKLPPVLNREEIARFLNAVTGLRNRVALTTAYAAGLRIGEVVRLKVGSIDSERMLIHIESAKGGKDRYAMLSPRLLEILRKRSRPSSWLFPGLEPGDHVSVGALQSACRAARRRSRIGKYVTAHSLRHSFATHLLESGHRHSDHPGSARSQPPGDDSALCPGRDRIDRRDAEPVRSARSGGHSARIEPADATRAGGGGHFPPPR